MTDEHVMRGTWHGVASAERVAVAAEAVRAAAAPFQDVRAAVEGLNVPALWLSARSRLTFGQFRRVVLDVMLEEFPNGG